MVDEGGDGDGDSEEPGEEEWGNWNCVGGVEPEAVLLRNLRGRRLARGGGSFSITEISVGQEEVGLATQRIMGLGFILGRRVDEQNLAM